MSRSGAGRTLARAGKRAMDLVLALLALAALSPVLAAVAVLVRLRLGAPVLYRQDRPGLGGRTFTIVKFRTMADARDTAGRPLPDSERLTRLGNVLRATSLDELPELWNVLTGDMSLVGPRPLLIRYTPYLTAEERLRLSVRPGITGWAQVNGRNDMPWDERLACDVWYVRNWSLGLDLRILARTFLRVLRSDGVVVDPSSVMLDLDDERRLRGAR
jgi:lipopolysaccharide/colanic/teichoic acid biosynthesis glycosyltransferase